MAYHVTVPPLAPFNFPLSVVVGDSIQFSIRVEAVDLRDYTLEATARRGYGVTPVLWSITSGSGIAVAWDGDDSIVTLTVAAAQTADLPTGNDAVGAVWDFRWTDPDGIVRTILSGPLRVYRSVSEVPVDG